MILWEEGDKIFKYLHHLLNKQCGIRNKGKKKTTFVIVSQNPYNDNE